MKVETGYIVTGYKLQQDVVIFAEPTLSYWGIFRFLPPDEKLDNA